MLQPPIQVNCAPASALMREGDREWIGCTLQSDAASHGIGVTFWKGHFLLWCVWIPFWDEFFGFSDSFSHQIDTASLLLIVNFVETIYNISVQVCVLERLSKCCASNLRHIVISTKVKVCHVIFLFLQRRKLGNARVKIVRGNKLVAQWWYQWTTNGTHAFKKNKKRAFHSPVLTILGVDETPWKESVLPKMKHVLCWGDTQKSCHRRHFHAIGVHLRILKTGWTFTNTFFAMQFLCVRVQLPFFLLAFCLRILTFHHLRAIRCDVMKC